MNLPLNLFDGNVNVRAFLCQPDKTIIGEILYYESNANFKFNTYSEISFTIDRYYNDLLDGKTKVNPYYDLVESLRVIYLQGIGHFSIQDVDENISDNESKSITCFSLEYTTGQKYLENFYINTGEEGSVEVMYHTQQYGTEYSIDNYYTIANGNFDPYEKYYIKEYSNEGDVSYNYVEIQVLDSNDFNKYKGENSETTLYIRKYPNVRFYWPTKPELSLLHLVFNRIPEWKIGHVDKELWYQERTFSEDRTAVYDFLYNQAAETLKYVMVWDSINGVTHFYKTTEDGMTTDNYVRTNTYNPNFDYYLDTKGTKAEPQPTSEKEVVEGIYYINIGKDIDTQWNTDVFVSKDNLTSAIDIKYSTDDIKTKLKIVGSDNLDVRDVNLGQNYVLNLSYYNTDLWLGHDLHKKYDEYIEMLTKYTTQYKELISKWSATYNEYSDLMNYVPVEPSVLLIGDEFDKLHCTYGLVKATEYVKDGAYFNADGTIAYNMTEDKISTGNYYINTVDMQLPILKKRLGLYRVGVDDNGDISVIDKNDDVLLTLGNDEGDSATIRVKCETTASKYEDYEYQVYVTKTTASSGLSNTKKYGLQGWIQGSLTSEGLELSRYKVKSIGTLGAYMCLSKDETQKENIEDYGIRLLEEKQQTYTKIFVTQTEGYMSQEGSRCVASDEAPEGASIGDKWLDTNSEGAKVSRWDGEKWVEYSINEKDNQDSRDYENYTRFYDNYQKLQVVQEVLQEKQRYANYLLNGIPVTLLYLTPGNVNLNNLLQAALLHFFIAGNKYIASDIIPSGDIEEGTIWIPIENGSLDTQAKQYKNQEWIPYEPEIPITLTGYNMEFGYITFKVNLDLENEYAVYVNNNIPYVSYSRSQGLCLFKMNQISKMTDMNTFFTEEEIVRLSPYIREDEYSDDNFLLTGYESEEEQMRIKQELLNEGTEELNKICQPKLSFSATMANILSIPEFAPLKNQFKLGNFIRVGIREGYVKRARLLEVQISFDDPSDFSATFGDLISTKSEIDKHADLLQQAVTAGKSVASNQSSWQKAVDKSTELDRRINDGLKDAALSVGSAQGQAITWDSGGIWGRKLVEGTTDQYEPEQFRLINNKLVFSSDGFATSKAVFGKYVINGETRWGPLAEYITADTIEGKFISGGSIEIGTGDTKFTVDEKGNVSIKSGGQDKYASVDALQQIKNAYQYSVRLKYEGSTVITGNETSGTTITAFVYKDGEDITNTLNSSIFNWKRNSGATNNDDEIWNNSHKGTKTITVTHSDVDNNTHFWCEVDI